MTDSPKTHFQLKRLSPKHKQVAALLAQGSSRTEISKIVHITPEYVTMLALQPLFKEYIKTLSAFVDTRMEALYEKGVDTVATLMQTGTEDTRLRAAQTVLKAVGKDGQADKTTVAVKFVVQLPSKALTTQDWEKQHLPRVINQE